MMVIDPGKVSLYTRLRLTIRTAYKFFKSTRGWHLYHGDKVSATFTIEVK